MASRSTRSSFHLPSLVSIARASPSPYYRYSYGTNSTLFFTLYLYPLPQVSDLLPFLLPALPEAPVDAAHLRTTCRGGRRLIDVSFAASLTHIELPDRTEVQPSADGGGFGGGGGGSSPSLSPALSPTLSSASSRRSSPSFIALAAGESPLGGPTAPMSPTSVAACGLGVAGPTLKAFESYRGLPLINISEDEYDALWDVCCPDCAELRDVGVPFAALRAAFHEGRYVEKRHVHT